MSRRRRDPMLLRSRMVLVRVSPYERQEMLRAARARGMRLATWLRWVALDRLIRGLEGER